MAIYSYGTIGNAAAHTLSEFIQMGSSDGAYSYLDLSFWEERNNFEFIIKNLLDDYIYDMLDMSVLVDLTSTDVETYKYNPKLMSYNLYDTTKLYYVILRLNNMCNIHDFTLSNKQLYLLSASDMSNCLSTIYKDNKQAMQTFNDYHSKDTIPDPITKYR